jgi:anti-sigma regulatory factor (Ser/Thr protein kinase)
MVPGPGSVRHTMLVYRNQCELAGAWSQYVEAAIADRAAVMVAATGQHLGILRSRFGPDRCSVQLAELSSLRADPGRVLSMLRLFAFEHVGRPLRFVQDVGWLDRPHEDLAEAVRYEALLRLALEGSDADILCCYDARLGAAALAAAERAHSAVPDAGPPPDTGRGQTAQAAGREAGDLACPPASARTLTFRGDQVAVRRLAEAQGRRAGLSAARVADLVIAVGELAGNTLCHTDGAGTLTIWTTPAELVCQVSDSGNIADPLAGTLRPDPTSVHTHRGLWLVRQVADLVQVRSGPAGTTVRVHFRHGG